MTTSAAPGARGPIAIDHVDVPMCGRCSGPCLLAAVVPTIVATAVGGVLGRSVVTLCPACDLDDPDAGPLITFLTVHEHITEATVDDAAHLVARWVDSARPKRVDQGALEKQYHQWLAGEL